MAEMSGGEVVAKMLSQENIETVFGIIDGTYFGFYSSLEPNGMQLITPRHETSAAHMAGAYARSTGQLGVCMASNGPGVANILPGLVVEQAEGNRVLVITSSRRTGIMYPDRGGTYQYFNQTGAIKQIAKWSEAVPSFDRIPELMRTALRQCYDGRPGVVHLDIPENILNGKFKSDLTFQQPSQYRLLNHPSPTNAQVEQASQLITKAKFPIIHAGSGVIHAQAYDELEQVAKQLQTMVTTSWAGRGAIRENSPLTMPMIHIETNNQIRREADLVLVLGSRVGETDWWGKAPYWDADQDVIQVDIDPSMIGMNKPITMGIQSDIKHFLNKLSDELPHHIKPKTIKKRQSTIKKYVEERKKYRRKLNEKLDDLNSPMNPAHVAAMAQDVFSRNVPVIADGGNTAIWSNFFTSIEKQGGLFSTFKFGMLGAGVAQALGVAAANPDEPVLCVIGDGAMGFHPQEIETAVRNDLNVIYLVVCDKQWGMVKINQNIALRPVKTIVKKSLDDGENINADLGDIAFDQLAKSMGAHGERVSDPYQLREALVRAKGHRGCTVIHCDVDPVKHMWAPGLKYFKDMHDEPKGK
ncbi:acetolactate synthase-1/2/3 large subunit [Alkalibacillus flavidus]|uniref:Acetolactate synthase-1/2/3 large subunit n=1 Tax=Alkalibacillus flavidus TaxID=546021 RepID=A0ABV2KTY5_9BACI